MAPFVLGARAVVVTGIATVGPNAQAVGTDLKFDALPPGGSAGEREALREATAGRPVWIAASTHEGEEAIALDVHRELRATTPGLLTIVVPRHPVRGDGLRVELERAGTVAQRSRRETIAPATDLYLGVTALAPAKITSPGNVAISARTLFDIVKNLPDGEVKLTTGQNHACTIQCGKVKYKIPGMPGDDFPPLPSSADATFHEVDVDVLAEAVSLTPCMGDERAYGSFCAGMEVGLRHRDGHRRTIGVAIQEQHARCGEAREVGRRPMRFGSVLPERRDRHHDEPRVDPV